MTAKLNLKYQYYSFIQYLIFMPIQLFIINKVFFNLNYKLNSTTLMRRIIYSIQGNIGSGKSTLLQIMAKRIQSLVTIPEPVKEWQNIKQHNLLDMYYQQPQRWAYTFQINAILSRMTQLNRSIKSMDHQNIYICQRSIMSDKYIFANLLKNLNKMSEMEHTLYLNMFQNLDSLFDTPKIHKYIYLKTSPEKAFERIKKRARSQQNNIQFDYIKKLHELHQNWLLNEQHKQNVLLINGEEEFENDEKVLNKNLTEIEQFLKIKKPKQTPKFSLQQL